MNFGEKLGYQLLKNGYNYSTEFAPKVDLSEKTINQYKRKETADGIDVMRLMKIANALGISLDYLIGNDDENEEIQIDDYKYINANNIESIQIEDLVNEMKAIIKDKECIFKNKEINDEKKYLIDSLDIGFKLIKQNT